MNDKRNNSTFEESANFEPVATMEPLNSEYLGISNEAAQKIYNTRMSDIAASMEPVTPLDATAHANSEWPDSPKLCGRVNPDLCDHCGLVTNEHGDDGCIGRLDESVVMSACCGHGTVEDAYLQLHDGTRLEGWEVVRKMGELKAARQASELYATWGDVSESLKILARLMTVWPSQNATYCWVVEGEQVMFTCGPAVNGDSHSKAQWQRARELYLAKDEQTVCAYCGDLCYPDKHECGQDEQQSADESIVIPLSEIKAWAYEIKYMEGLNKHDLMDSFEQFISEYSSEDQSAEWNAPKGFQCVSEVAISWLFNNHPEAYAGFYERIDASQEQQAEDERKEFIRDCLKVAPHGMLPVALDAENYGKVYDWLKSKNRLTGKGE